MSKDMAREGRISNLLITSEVAQMLHVHVNTVRRWSDEGLIKTYRLGTRGDRRFKQEDIARFLAEPIMKTKTQDPA